jgi:arylsulfatase
METGFFMKIRNVFLVSLDTTRTDVLLSGAFPGIESIRANAICFPNCVAPVPLTPPSHASVMTGLLPWRHGLRHMLREKMDPQVATLAQILKDTGFDTSAIVSCPGLNEWYKISRGFDHYDDDIPLLPDGSDPVQTVDVKLRGFALKRADEVIERSRRYLDCVSRERPLFHFVHFFDAHWPYEPPTRPYKQKVRNEYEAEIAYVDHHLSQWWNHLKAQGLLEDSLVVIFGDHGEDLNGWYPNDKGGEALGHPEEQGHGCLLYDQTILVPLLFWHASWNGRMETQQVRLVDVLPTILDLIGREAPAGLDGTSLKRAVLDGHQLPPLVGYSETLWPREQVDNTNGEFGWTRNKKALRIENRYKVIFHMDSDMVEVYDLLRDPHENVNLVAGK